ncbi:hypothetical protein ACLB2K_012717 [Fragaria x ananassa]
MRVDIDSRRPLATFTQLPRPNLAPKKIYLQYEHLKSFCYNCGRLGHMIAACRYHVNPISISLGVKYDDSDCRPSRKMGYGRGRGKIEALIADVVPTIGTSEQKDVIEGMEDFTHLQGCGSWPNAAARSQGIGTVKAWGSL